MRLCYWTGHIVIIIVIIVITTIIVIVNITLTDLLKRLLHETWIQISPLNGQRKTRSLTTCGKDFLLSIPQCNLVILYDLSLLFVSPYQIGLWLWLQILIMQYHPVKWYRNHVFYSCVGKVRNSKLIFFWMKFRIMLKTVIISDHNQIQALSVRALQEIISSNDAEAVSPLKPMLL